MKIAFEDLHDYLRLGWQRVGEYIPGQDFIFVEKTNAVPAGMKRIMKSVNVLWSGWECDSRAWLIETDHGLELITTDHGSLVKADSGFLRDRLREYEEVLEKTREIVEIMDCRSRYTI